MQLTRLITFISPFALLLSSSCGKEQMMGGFNIENALIPINEIHSGGPPKDGIPSINQPKFIAAEKADYLNASDSVLGLTIGGESRAYPLRILVWHEIVNDTIDGQAVIITYCPLCGTAMAFSRQYGEKPLSFGVSGLLYNSDVLMFDRETESLWSQLKMQAVSGQFKGQAMDWLPSTLTTWEDWQNKQPETVVLSTETGYPRDYTKTPYASYESTERTMFPVKHTRQELPNKAWIAGIRINEEAKAYPLAQLSEASFEDVVGGTPIRISWDAGNRHFSATRADGTDIPVVHAYWFAWQAFYPGTTILEFVPNSARSVLMVRRV